MKKITFILFALIAGTSFGQEASRASGVANVSAEIVSPISVTGVSALNFGRIIGNSEGGNVRVNTEGDRTFSNPNLNAPSTGDDLPTAAVFNIVAADQYSYSIFIPTTTISLSGENDMSLTFVHSMEASGNKGTGADQELLVGGLLTVNPDQAEGIYEGEVTVTVAYE